MGSSEGLGSTVDNSGSASGGGNSGSPDLKAILDYLNHIDFGSNGDYTNISGYGGDRSGKSGYKPREKDPPVPDPFQPQPAQPSLSFPPPAGLADHWRNMEPFSGAQAPKGSLFAFLGEDVDPYSGMALGSERLDPYTGTQITDPFIFNEHFTPAQNTLPSADIHRKGLLSSPNLIADNGPIPCDSRLAECPPKRVMSDATTSSLYNLDQAEADESDVALMNLREGRTRLMVSPVPDVQKTIAETVRILQSDEYKLAYEANKLRTIPLEVKRSAVWVGVGHMVWGGVLLVGSGVAIYGSGGTAAPLLSTMGLSTGIAQLSSGALLAFSGGSYTETVRMGQQLEQAFAFTSSPSGLVFGTTGLVLSNGDPDVAYRFAVTGGALDDAMRMRFDRSKLFSGVLPKIDTAAEKSVAAMVVKDVAKIGQSRLISPPAGKELYVGEWLNRNLEAKLDETVRSFVADPHTMAQLVPPTIPYRAVPQYGGFVIEYGQKAAVEGDWLLNSIVRGVPQSSQMVRGGAPDLVLRPPFADWNLRAWDVTTDKSAWAKAARGVDYTFLKYSVDWSSLRL